MKHLVGKKVTTKASFLGEQLEIKKLSVDEILKIQESTKQLEEDGANQLATLRIIINAGVEGAKELSDEEFNSFPVDDLTKLSAEVLKFSGLGQDTAEGN